MVPQQRAKVWYDNYKFTKDYYKKAEVKTSNKKKRRGQSIEAEYLKDDPYKKTINLIARQHSNSQDDIFGQSQSIHKSLL